MPVRPRIPADLPRCVEVLATVNRNDGYPGVELADPAVWLCPPSLAAAWVAEARVAETRLAERPAPTESKPGIGQPTSEPATTIVGHVALRDRADIPALLDATGRPADELALITRLFVHPSARRGGHGRALLAAAADHARHIGRLAVLDVVETGIAAIALYERLGWQCVGRGPAPWITSDAEHPTVRYYTAP